MRLLANILVLALLPNLVLANVSANGVSINKASISTSSPVEPTPDPDPDPGEQGGPITITSPAQYRVFQRSGTTGSITISGTYTGTAVSGIEASFKGGAYSTIVATPTGGSFTGILTGQTQGQGQLRVRFVGAAEYRAVENIGIGDVYIVAGQSNATGHGNTPYQAYTHATLKATNFANDYTWKDLVDPFDSENGQLDSVSNDDLTGEEARGSWVPELAELIMNDQGVPVAFIPCPKGSTRIEAWLPGSNHQNRNTLYGSMVYRGLQAGPVKAVLWWQGESDQTAGTTQATYNARLDLLANSIFSDLGVKLVVCKLPDGAYPPANEAAIRAAIDTAWNDNPNVLEGPDFGDMTTDDGAHFRSQSKLLIASQRWWTALEALFY